VALLATSLALLAAAIPGGSQAAAERARTPEFSSRVEPIGAQLRARMTGVSWHPGCPVGLGRLRLLTVSRRGFDGRPHRGRLVVNRDAAAAMTEAMRRLYRLRYPIRRMRLVDAYGADDHRSMAVDNTSAFNCRLVAGSGHWSEHAFGRAIDLNPLENPYVTAGGYVSPPGGAPYADRSSRALGLIHRHGPVVAAFDAVGWGWGGGWNWPKDYQHFSAGGH
jgi:hypothetical protein